MELLNDLNSKVAYEQMSELIITVPYAAAQTLSVASFVHQRI